MFAGMLDTSLRLAHVYMFLPAFMIYVIAIDFTIYHGLRKFNLWQSYTGSTEDVSP